MLVVGGAMGTNADQWAWVPETQKKSKHAVGEEGNETLPKTSYFRFFISQLYA